VWKIQKGENWITDSKETSTKVTASLLVVGSFTKEKYNSQKTDQDKKWQVRRIEPWDCIEETQDSSVVEDKNDRKKYCAFYVPIAGCTE
jgi:hypothetical protein